MIRREIQSTDGKSIFRVEENGKIRLILQPENRAIMIGWINDKDLENVVLLLTKSNSNFDDKSYTLGVPKEILDAYKYIKTVAINTLDSSCYYCTSVSELNMFGLIDNNAKIHRQTYVFLEFKYWKEVSLLEEVLSFQEDQKGYHEAIKGVQDGRKRKKRTNSFQRNETRR